MLEKRFFVKCLSKFFQNYNKIAVTVPFKYILNSTYVTVSEINADGIFFFSQFLNDNFDYDEGTALEQLSTYGLKSFMFDVAKVITINNNYTRYLLQQQKRTLGNYKQGLVERSSMPTHTQILLFFIGIS